MSSCFFFYYIIGQFDVTYETLKDMSCLVKTTNCSFYTVHRSNIVRPMITTAHISNTRIGIGMISPNVSKNNESFKAYGKERLPILCESG